jgi:hypothetical protein
MARTMSSPLSILSEHASKAADDTTSESTRDQVVETIMVPIKDSGGIRKPSRRSSWKFNTDWEGAISSFKSASSMLSSSLSSWYHVLDIDEEEEDHDDDGKESGMGDPNHHNNRSKENSFKRPSLHSTMLKEEEARSSFAKASFGGSLADDDDRIDSLEELHR